MSRRCRSVRRTTGRDVGPGHGPPESSTAQVSDDAVTTTHGIRTVTAATSGHRASTPGRRTSVRRTTGPTTKSSVSRASSIVPIPALMSSTLGHDEASVKKLATTSRRTGCRDMDDLPERAQPTGALDRGAILAAWPPRGDEAAGQPDQRTGRSGEVRPPRNVAAVVPVRREPCRHTPERGELSRDPGQQGRMPRLAHHEDEVVCRSSLPWRPASSPRPDPKRHPAIGGHVRALQVGRRASVQVGDLRPKEEPHAQ